MTGRGVFICVSGVRRAYHRTQQLAASRYTCPHTYCTHSGARSRFRPHPVDSKKIGKIKKSKCVISSGGHSDGARGICICFRCPPRIPPHTAAHSIPIHLPTHLPHSFRRAFKISPSPRGPKTKSKKIKNKNM